MVNNINELFNKFSKRQSFWVSAFKGEAGDYVLTQLFDFCHIGKDVKKGESLEIIEGRRQVYNFISKCRFQDLDSLREKYEKEFNKKENTWKNQR